MEGYLYFPCIPSWRGQVWLLSGMEGNIFCTFKCTHDRFGAPRAARSKELESPHFALRRTLKGQGLRQSSEIDWLLRRYPKRDEVTGEWRKLHYEELNDMWSSPNIVRVTKSRRMR